MSARRINPYRIKRYRSYEASELATLLGVHKNTVRQWTREGLEALSRTRPALFQGETIRAFLVRRNASRKRPCPPGTIYCFRCREARQPAGAMADYAPVTAVSGNLKALCGECETTMHRRVRFTMLGVAMPGVDVRIMQAAARLDGTTYPSPNCDSGTRAVA